MRTYEGLHGKVINYSDLNKTIPYRDKILNKTQSARINDEILNGKKIVFFPTGLYDGKAMQNYQYDKARYKIVLFGVLETGKKISVIINDIEPYFEIKVPIDRKEDYLLFAEELNMELNMTSDNYDEYLKVINKPKTNSNMEWWKIETTKFEITKGKPLKYFQENEETYIRFYFNKVTHRRDAIKYIRAKGYETVHDDISCYYRVVCRDELISFSSWLELTDFTHQNDGVNNYIKGDVIQVSIKNIRELKEVPLHLEKDNTMTMCWDIETYNSLEDGKIPQPQYKEHCIFMIGITFQWHHSNDQLLRICLVDVPSAPHPDFLTIVCHNEINLIKAFAKCYEKFRPEIVLGFNDASYDWPWIIERSKQYPGLLKYIGDRFDMTIDDKRTDKSTLYSYRSLSIKIEADVNANGNNLQLQGYIPIDVMISFRQLYPTSEKWNLNFFLSKNKLGSKEDMPYQEMFDIYKQALELKEQDQTDAYLLERMALVAKYCVIDAQRCHELMKIRTVLQDKREVSKGSYTSVFDAFYRANGMKVRNLAIAKGQLRGLKMSNIPNEVAELGKYPGAWVFPPKKGLVTSKLSIDERIKKAQLGFKEYGEWLTKSDDEIIQEKELIEKYGCQMNKNYLEICDLSPSFRTMLNEDTGRPITGLDFSSLYPSLIMTYNLSPEYIISYERKKYAKHIDSLKDEEGNKKYNLHRIQFPFNGRIIKGWSVRHDNKLDPTSKDYRFGIFPSILKELFDTRKKLKKSPKGLEYWEHRKEEMLNLSKETFETKEIQEEFEEVCFQYNKIDSKQKALKVFMNTFYGEAGNKRSPLFMLHVAGGITTAGQRNIKLANKFVIDRGCKVYYGDSVPKDEPVLIRYPNGNIDIRTIDDIPYSSSEFEILFEGDAHYNPDYYDYNPDYYDYNSNGDLVYDKWFDYSQFKPNEIEPIRINKQQHLPLEGLEIWTSSGWKLLKRVIRHKTNKRMFRINTHTGVIDVTEDHSLLTKNKEILKPGDAKIGDNLLHSFPTEFNNMSYTLVKKDGLFEREITEDEAWFYGAFFGRGKIAYNKDCSKVYGSWSIAQCNVVFIMKCKLILEKMENNDYFTYSVYNNEKYKTPLYILKLRDDLNKEFVSKYRNLFYTKNNLKKVPKQILNAAYNIRKAFYKGYIDSYGYKNTSIPILGKIGNQGLYYLLKSLEFRPLLNSIDNKINMYILRSSKHVEKPLTQIKKIIEIQKTNQDDFVYDIETEDGTFLAGVGSICVKNTDSLYISMPEYHFEKLDKDFYSGKISKLKYWEDMVNVTFDTIKTLNKDVNQMFLDDNGTEFLKMAYEEALFPVLFTAKKKYVGTPHISIPNFDPKAPLFIRGLELKKRGVSKFLKNVCNDILKKCVNVENILTVIELVQRSIKDIYSQDWSDHFEDFIMTAVYKPDKNNVKVHTFRKRMLEERNITLKPGERINYVIVQKFPYRYTLRGCKIPLKIGDKMELSEIAKTDNMAIDLDYYMDKSVNGQLARFITYHPDFHIEPSNYEDNDEVKKTEDKILKKARKCIDEFCKGHYTEYKDLGSVKKKAFRLASKIVQEKITQAFGMSGLIAKILTLNIDIKENDNIIDRMTREARKTVEGKRDNKNYGKVYIENSIKNLNKYKKREKIVTLQNLYYADKENSFINKGEKEYKEREVILISRLIQYIGKFKSLFNMNNDIIEELINYIDGTDETDIVDSNKELIEELHILTEDLIDINKIELVDNLNEINYIYYNLISNYEYIYRLQSICSYLKELRNIHVRNIEQPADIESLVDKLIKETTEEYLKY